MLSPNSQDSGGQDQPKSGLAVHDPSIQVGTEGAGKRGLQAHLLPAQAGDDRHHLAIGSSHYRRRLQLLASQGGPDAGGAVLGLPAPARPTQCRHQLGMRQRPAQLRGRGQLQDGDRITTTGIIA